MMKHVHDPDYPTPAMKELFAAVLKISSSDEEARFFRDLLTIAELKEFANRWAVVKLLYEGRSYEAIAKRLMISTATVTRVAHWLHHGMDGYRAVATRMNYRSTPK
ncbi:helix-turn-helix domain-containing protein [Candidatus Gottesmanbacteria bacterium]|nr:helix-turn-helix domain-containing protein [Candidatus Gottesmanbacteria bacterium]